jgi:hypothetical protein
LGIEVSEPRRYPEYHPEYYAIFFADPDRMRLEIVARTSTRQTLEARWEKLEELLNTGAIKSAGIVTKAAICFDSKHEHK